MGLPGCDVRDKPECAMNLGSRRQLKNRGEAPKAGGKEFQGNAAHVRNYRIICAYQLPSYNFLRNRTDFIRSTPRKHGCLKLRCIGQVALDNDNVSSHGREIERG